MVRLKQLFKKLSEMEIYDITTFVPEYKPD